MSYTEQEIRSAATPLIDSFDGLLVWRWEEEKDVLLAEFASGKTEQVETVLKQYYADEWNRKSIKKAPKGLVKELAGYAKLVKEQRVFTNSPQEDNKSVVALLWPWGHGSTLSLRLTLLENAYEYVEAPETKSLVSQVMNKFKSVIS